MAELAVIDDAAQNDADFLDGFNAETPPAKPAGTDAPTKADVPPSKADAAPASKDASAVVTPPAAEPKYVQLTQEQFDALDAAAKKTAGIESQLSKVFGTVGNIQQTVNKLKGAPAADATVEPPKPVTPVSDEDRWQKMIQETSVKYQLEALEELHPTWREIVGTVDSEGKHDPSNEFRKWLATQPADYQHKVNNANSSVVVSRAIDKFLSSKAAPAPKTEPQAQRIAARNDRIRAAIPPRGDGGQPASSKTADDEFSEGFRTG